MINNEEKRVWGIHTKDDNLFLQKDVIAIGWRDMGDLSKKCTNNSWYKRNRTGRFDFEIL